MGLVMINSPTSSVNALPVSSNAYTATPKARHCISPAYKGAIGHAVTNAAAVSVPPLMEANKRSAFTC